ncbi:MarR family winged helix-turn-helix transcriptional regulator [Edaphobacter sp.]|uniref:MarR family winged helix-turn-helix transcriptional regulator n=1 Tax=Edaphobacter sp. TaxID=1934404 RepID=UPI002DB9E97F|nr:MarR family winged helix-turn-helix transcriptional regulator [Edaphobacter sp.]HEU5340421.1 MarR family winged helix-turn-helix transcriptional regulator [Edaphobacter sp.]
MSDSIPALPCLCGSFRRAARALTQTYEEALRPLGLRATQMTTLQVLTRTGEVSQGRLGQILAIDSTTLTRTLAIMVREGWVRERRGKDRRERLLSLSKTGQRKLERATPVWEEVQARLRTRLEQGMGDGAWDAMMRSANQIAGLATTEIAEGESR